MATQDRTMTFDEMLAFEEGWADDAPVSSDSTLTETHVTKPKDEEQLTDAKVVGEQPSGERILPAEESVKPESTVDAKAEKKSKKAKTTLKSERISDSDDELWQLYTDLLSKGEKHNDKTAYLGRIGMTPRVYDAIKRINSKQSVVVNAILEAFLEKYKDRLKEIATKRTDDFKPIF